MVKGIRDLYGTLLLLVMLGMTACSPKTDLSVTPTAPDTVPGRASPSKTPPVSPIDRSQFFLWAESAEASSVFAEPEWGAEKAAGEPDAPGCGDYQFAWASAASDSIETLTLNYGAAVIPAEIRIVQSFNPDQVVKVEIFNLREQRYVTVLEKQPEQVDRPCPYTLQVPVEGVDFLTNRVRITIDQSILGLGWNEIDAVQLIGSPETREGGE
ncbi:MAG: hypothetical protein U5K99_09960 [Anaerolineales bacterium]|nr:hypothetical protein [Anaerolineales bacterium]